MKLMNYIAAVIFALSPLDAFAQVKLLRNKQDKKMDELAEILARSYECNHSVKLAETDKGLMLSCYSNGECEDFEVDFLYGEYCEDFQKEKEWCIKYEEKCLKYTKILNHGYFPKDIAKISFNPRPHDLRSVLEVTLNDCKKFEYHFDNFKLTEELKKEIETFVKSYKTYNKSDNK